jgi:AraC-like DNA-binding protein
MRVAQESISHADQSLRLLRFEVDARRGERHRHRHIELTWIEKGDGLRLVGDSAMPFESGDLVLLGSNVPHAWLTARRSTATVVQFAPELLSNAALPELARAAPLAERAGLGLRVTGACHAEVTAVLARMPAANAVARLAGLVAMIGLLLEHQRALTPLASSPMRKAGAHGADSPTPLKRSEGRRIDAVIDWIHHSIARELTVDEAAQRAHVTPAAFSRYFRREVGKTFTRYLNDVRCSEACIRLRRTDKPVAVVAHECGFATMSHFNRQFRQRVGVAPREYRNPA